MLQSIFLVSAAFLAKPATCASIPLSLTPPENTSQPVLDSFVSFSIEFSSFPDFAGKSVGDGGRIKMNSEALSEVHAARSVKEASQLTRRLKT